MPSPAWLRAGGTGWRTALARGITLERRGGDACRASLGLESSQNTGDRQRRGGGGAVTVSAEAAGQRGSGTRHEGAKEESTSSGRHKYTRMNDSLYSYVLGLMSESEVLEENRAFTATQRGSHMQTPPDQAQFLSLLVKLTNAKHALEVGVFTGYSALAVASALPDDGRLFAVDHDPRTNEVARNFFRKAGVEDKVSSVEGDAVEELDKLLASGHEDYFDFAFIDANKRKQRTYYEQCLRLVRKGGLIVVDNVLWYGRIAEEEDQSKITLSIRELNAFISRDDRVMASFVPIGDGLALCLVL